MVRRPDSNRQAACAAAGFKPAAVTDFATGALGHLTCRGEIEEPGEGNLDSIPRPLSATDIALLVERVIHASPSCRPAR